MSTDGWTTVTAADDVTEEILKAAESIFDGWYANEPRIDWEDFVDRLDGIPLDNGTQLDLDGNLMSPAIQKIQKHIRTYHNS